MRKVLLIAIQLQTSSTITALVCFHGNLPDGGAINEKREKKRPLQRCEESAGEILDVERTFQAALDRLNSFQTRLPESQRFLRSGLPSNAPT